MSIDPRAALPAFLALSCVGGFATAARAADDEPAIVVIGTAVHAAELDGAKAVAPLLDTPRSVVVVDKEIIKQTGSATLVEALRTVPGITFGAAEGGNPIGDRPFIRGFDSQGSTYLDGVRDIGAQSREVFDVEQIEVVRGSDSTLGGRGSAGGTLNIVSKLPRARNFAEASVSYGTADYKRVTADLNAKVSDTIAVRLTGAWHDQDVAGRDALYQKRWGIAPSVTVGIGTPTRLTAAWYHLRTDELPDSGIPYLYTVNNAPLGRSLSEPAVGRVTTIAGVTGTVPRSAFYGLIDRDFRQTTVDQGTVRAEHDFGGVTLRNTARYSRTAQAYIYTQPDDSQGDVFGTNAANPATAGGQVWRRANTRYGTTKSLIDQLDVSGKLNTGGITHSFAAGIELSVETARRGTFVTRGLLNPTGNSAGFEMLATGATISPRCTPAAVSRYYCTSLFAPNPSDHWVNYASDTSTTPAAIVRSLAIEETQNDATTAAVYGFDSITLTDRLIVNLGARFDSFRSTVTPGQPVAATTTYRLRRDDNLFNYQAGVVFKPTPETSVYASYATAATPPNSLLGEGLEGNSLGTTASAAALLDTLKVEKSRSAEVGAKADAFGERLSLTAALFDTRTENARVIGDGNTPSFVGKRRIRGVELGFNGRPAKGWTLFGGYTYLDARIVDGGFTALAVAANGPRPATTVQVVAASTGQRFPQTAKHSFTLWSNYDVTPRLTLGGGAFYTSRVYGGYADNRTASQDANGTITVTPATRIIARAVPAYWRFDARIAYRLGDHADVSVNVQNLTDKVYFSQANASHYATIAPGRSAFATLNMRY